MGDRLLFIAALVVAAVVGGNAFARHQVVNEAAAFFEIPRETGAVEQRSLPMPAAPRKTVTATVPATPARKSGPLVLAAPYRAPKGYGRGAASGEKPDEVKLEQQKTGQDCWATSAAMGAKAFHKDADQEKIADLAGKSIEESAPNADPAKTALEKLGLKAEVKEGTPELAENAVYNVYGSGHVVTYQKKDGQTTRFDPMGKEEIVDGVNEPVDFFIKITSDESS